MATIVTPLPGDHWVVFHEVPWRTYLDLLKARGDGRFRLSYHRGVLEIMTLSKLHEILSEVLDNFVKVLVKEYGLEVQSAGSMTIGSSNQCPKAKQALTAGPVCRRAGGPARPRRCRADWPMPGRVAKGSSAALHSGQCPCL